MFLQYLGIYVWPYGLGGILTLLLLHTGNQSVFTVCIFSFSLLPMKYFNRIMKFSIIMVGMYVSVCACLNGNFFIWIYLLMNSTRCLVQQDMEPYNNPCLRPSHVVMTELFVSSNRHFYCSI